MSIILLPLSSMFNSTLYSCTAIVSLIPAFENVHNKTQRGIQDLAKLLNPKIRGWVRYYGKISRRSLQPVFYYLHNRLISGY